MVDGMGISARKLWDDQLVDYLRNGQTRLCYDGQYFFDTDHPISKLDPSISGTQVNYAASGVALTLDNYIAKRAVMAAFKGDNNQPLGVMADTLVVPPQLEGTARLIAEADFVINTTGATPGAGAATQSNVMKGTARVLVIPELAADATTWYLADTSKPLKPFFKQVRTAPRFVAKNSLQDDNVFWRKTYVFGAEARGAIGYGPWWLMSKWVA
jgi:phage major head subunit gpT-like protein